MTFALHITTPAEMKAFTDKVARQGKASANRLRNDVAKAHNFGNITAMYHAMATTPDLPQHLVLHETFDGDILEVLAIPDGVDPIDGLMAAARLFQLDTDGLTMVRETGSYITTRSELSLTTTQTLRDAHDDDATALLCCDNCGFTAGADTMDDAEDLPSRLTRGGLYTDKECPACGALAFPVTLEELVTHYPGEPEDVLHAMRKRSRPARINTTTNSNCLAGMACPSCLDTGAFLIQSEGDSPLGDDIRVVAMEHWTDDGTDGFTLHGTISMVENGTCVCQSCSHEGEVESFMGFTTEE